MDSSYPMIPPSCPALDASDSPGRRRSQEGTSRDQCGLEFVTANCTSWQPHQEVPCPDHCA
eukprot:599398-Pyramimonas_sp.AAC.1